MTGKRGLRCQICTGCGLCPGVTPRLNVQGLHILTDEGKAAWMDPELQPETAWTTLPEKGIYRLVAADVGTTTIAMELYDESGKVRDTYVTVNPQGCFGRDVLSRIAASEDMMQRKELEALVKSALTQGAKRFLRCLRDNEGLFLVIAANTTMSYLLMGWDPRELGQAPFVANKLSGAAFFLSCEEWQIPCLLLPGISAFVGGDIYAGIYASAMAEHEDVSLLVDLGTNGEMAIGNRKRILATATAAGPAFEGGANKGVWGADMVHLVAALRREKVLDETGLLAEPYFSKGIRIGNVLLTQEAIRSLQLAKAAIFAGMEILCKEYGIAPQEIDRVILAGGFGYYLQPKDAVCIGMLPKGLAGKTVSGGNTALLGAKRIGMHLLRACVLPGEETSLAEWKRSAMEAIGDMPARTETLNLAMHTDFSECYVKSMNFCERD